MTGTIRIERATAADAEAIASIVRGLGKDENIGLPAEFDAETARTWLSRLGENGVILLAYEGSIPVAFGAIDYSTVEPNTALLGVWVLPDFRRRGIGTALAEELLEFARERGYKRIRGRLPEGNEPALSFLSSIGAMVPLRNPDMRFELPL
ncbi:MAG: GNAT family N-acetyltransferase [Chloroflexota bacterium]|jgi:GNAT superfamily N-acetyltransferase|nr:GNAT family N-acetyltransferase [Chloroflexota bacterium]